jgi:hypothetical protein
MGMSDAKIRAAELAVIDAARFVASGLENGFVVCSACGEQETTHDMDGVADLVAALIDLDLLAPLPTPRTPCHD